MPDPVYLRPLSDVERDELRESCSPSMYENVVKMIELRDDEIVALRARLREYRSVVNEWTEFADRILKVDHA